MREREKISLLDDSDMVRERFYKKIWFFLVKIFTETRHSTFTERKMDLEIKNLTRSNVAWQAKLQEIQENNASNLKEELERFESEKLSLVKKIRELESEVDIHKKEVELLALIHERDVQRWEHDKVWFMIRKTIDSEQRES